MVTSGSWERSGTAVPGSVGDGLEEHRGALAGGRAHRDQPALDAAGLRRSLVRQLGEGRDQAAAGGGEGVPGREGGAGDVELGAVDAAERSAAAQSLPAELLGLPGLQRGQHRGGEGLVDLVEDRKSTRLNSSHVSISYAVFCLKKKKTMT